MLKALILWGTISVVAVLLVIQAIPYGRDHANPPVRQEPAWDSPQTQALAARACYDCHSNQTNWPWYSNVAPLSWLLQRDVHNGRGKLNFSEWDRPHPEARESAEAVQEGEMPPASYRLLRANARLSAAQREALMRGLEATFGRGGRGVER